MVANPNSTILLENIPLFLNLKNTLQENMGYLIHHLSFFQAGIKVPIVLFSWTLVYFLILFYFFSIFHE
jgi:hypothetical protein